MHKTDKVVFFVKLGDVKTIACPKVYERPRVLHMGHVETRGPGAEVLAVLTTALLICRG